MKPSIPDEAYLMAWGYWSDHESFMWWITNTNSHQADECDCFACSLTKAEGKNFREDAWLVLYGKKII